MKSHLLPIFGALTFCLLCCSRSDKTSVSNQEQSRESSVFDQDPGLMALIIDKTTGSSVSLLDVNGSLRVSHDLENDGKPEYDFQVTGNFRSNVSGGRVTFHDYYYFVGDRDYITIVATTGQAYMATSGLRLYGVIGGKNIRMEALDDGTGKMGIRGSAFTNEIDLPLHEVTPDNRSQIESFTRFWKRFVPTLMNRGFIGAQSLATEELTIMGEMDHQRHMTPGAKAYILADVILKARTGKGIAEGGEDHHTHGYFDEHTVNLSSESARFEDFEFTKSGSEWLFSGGYVADFGADVETIRDRTISPATFVEAISDVEYSRVSFMVDGGITESFYLYLTNIDREDNPFFETVSEEGVAFSQYVTKPGATDLFCMIYYGSTMTESSASDELVSTLELIDYSCSAEDVDP